MTRITLTAALLVALSGGAMAQDCAEVVGCSYSGTPSPWIGTDCIGVVGCLQSGVPIPIPGYSHEIPPQPDDSCLGRCVSWPFSFEEQERQSQLLQASRRWSGTQEVPPQTAGLSSGAMQAPRHYTVAEIDRMRAAVRARIRGEFDCGSNPHNLCLAITDTYPPAQMVEDRLRTYIAAGVDPVELEMK